MKALDGNVTYFATQRMPAEEPKQKAQHRKPSADSSQPLAEPLPTAAAACG